MRSVVGSTPRGCQGFFAFNSTVDAVNRESPFSELYLRKIDDVIVEAIESARWDTWLTVSIIIILYAMCLFSSLLSF